MLKLIGSLFKMLVFAVIVLVLGSWIHWNGQTLSDQIRSHVSEAQDTPWFQRAKNWASDLIEDAKGGSKRHSVHRKWIKTENSVTQDSDLEQTDEISKTERQKLRALIKELNGSERNN